MNRVKQRKTRLLAALLALCAALLSGCGQREEPPVQTEPPPIDITVTPTPARDALLPEIRPNADGSTVEQREVTLYYRMKGEDILAPETRTVYLRKDKPVEQELIEALIGGPSPGALDLTSLFDSGTKVKVWSSESLLTVQLSREFLVSPLNVPALWEDDPALREIVFTGRQLGLAAIVNTITEATNYTAVQFMVLDRNDELTGRRLKRSEVYDGAPEDELVTPMVRSEHNILTHNNAAGIIMESWKERDFERLYRFVAQEDTTRPTDAAFLEEMQGRAQTLLSYSLSAGVVTEDGQQAVVEASCECVEEGEQVTLQSFPLRLTRENGLWKIPYAELIRMMEAL